MLKIQQRSSAAGAIFALSGRIEIDDVAELQRLFGLEAPGQGITLDLRDVTLIDRDAVKFLAGWETEKIKIQNCPAYIRDWVDAEKGRTTGKNIEGELR